MANSGMTLADMLSDYEHLWRQAQGIPGHVTKNEGLLLYLFGAQQCSEGHIVEVGSFHGRSSLVLGCGMLKQRQRNGKLVCIDNFVKQSSRSFPHAINPKQALLENIIKFGLTDIFYLYEADSVEALESMKAESCGLVFIDSDHNETQISQEFPLAVRALSRRGVVLIHDYRNSSMDAAYTKWIDDQVRSRYETVFVQDSTPSYGGNGLLIVKPKSP